MSRAHQIIHYLLYTGEPCNIAQIADFLDILPEDILQELPRVKELLGPLSLEIIKHENTLCISIEKTIASKFHSKENKDLVKPLSESALQTLSVIIYKNGATKAEVDFVRGVDSARSLKTLILRGLIHKESSKNKKVYTATLDTLIYMGLEDITQLPSFESTNSQLRLLLDQD